MKGIEEHRIQVAVPDDSIEKHPPEVQKKVHSLCQEHPLEEEMTTHTSILAWTILWTESLELPRVRHE